MYCCSKCSSVPSARSVKRIIFSMPCSCTHLRVQQYRRKTETTVTFYGCSHCKGTTVATWLPEEVQIQWWDKVRPVLTPRGKKRTADLLVGQEWALTSSGWTLGLYGWSVGAPRGNKAKRRVKMLFFSSLGVKCWSQYICPHIGLDRVNLLQQPGGSMARLFHTTSHHYQEQGKQTLLWRGVFLVKKENVAEGAVQYCPLSGVFFMLFLFLYLLTLVLL